MSQVLSLDRPQTKLLVANNAPVTFPVAVLLLFLGALKSYRYGIVPDAILFN